MLVRIIAAALIGWAVVDVSLYLVLRNHNQQPVEVLPVILKSIPFVIGVFFFIKARSLADWLSDKLDL